MFVSQGQFSVFLLCCSFGFAIGIIYSFFYIIKSFFRLKIACYLLDIFFFIVASFLFVFYSLLLNFPNYKFYMPLGVLFGLFIYCESFNFMLAKCIKKIYNIIKKFLQKMKNCFNKIKAKRKLKDGSVA